MEPTSIFQDPAWYRALTLTERRCLLASQPLLGSDRELAEKRLVRWRSQHPFDDDFCFGRRLAVEELDLDRFTQILGTDAATLVQTEPPCPDWLQTVIQAFADYPEMRLPEKLEQAQTGNATLGFLVPIAPLLQAAVARTRAGVAKLLQTYEDAPVDPQTIAGLLLSGLPEQLIAMLNRTLILELHVAKLGGCLQGEDAATRFTSFIEQLRDPARALAFLKEYAVLTRQVVTALDQRVRFGLELVAHLCCDAGALRQTFGCEKLGRVTHLSLGAGDQHGDGRSVVVFSFSDGFRVVYKPRSLAVEQAFQNLLQQLNNWGAEPALRTLRVLERAHYGWVEFVEAAPCADAAGATRFFRRQGALLALLYALQATDFHHENLIAAGDQPVLIDLESLFHPHLGMPGGDQGSQRLAFDAMNYSVLRIGLLPNRLYTAPGVAGVDISGLAAREGQMSPHAVPVVAAADEEDWRVVHRHVVLPGSDNRARLDGQVLDPLAYADSIVDGFSAMYRLLQRERGRLLAEDGPLAVFGEADIRVILRPTRLYGLFLRDSLHPDFLREGLDRERFFDRLWANVGENPNLASVIVHEKKDLQRGDVPLFTAKPNRRGLWSAPGVEIPDFLEQAPLQRVRTGLAAFGDDDLKRQTWFIQASLATLQQHHDHRHDQTRVLPTAAEPVTPAQLLAAAEAVADRLHASAVDGENDATWIGVTMAGLNEWTLNPLGPDLYDGLPGVILFLAYLAEVTGEPRHRRLAERALVTLENFQQAEDLVLSSVGVYSGLAGMLYLYTHLGVLWQKHSYLERAVAYAPRIAAAVADDQHFDVVAGSAGALAALLGLYRVDPHDVVLTAAVACGDHLCRTAQAADGGLAWQVDSMGSRPLTGFSHGTAGIAWALSALADQTGDGRYHDTARAAFAYERAHFQAGAGNWSDLRDMSLLGGSEGLDADHFESAWCHGAPGIALSRVLSGAFRHDSEAQSEIQTAVATTLRAGFGQNHSLCHGDLGHLDILHLIAQTCDDRDLAREVNRLAAAVLADIRAQGYRCGLPLAVESPGLMTGLAGIGFGLLRLAAPHAVPSILALADPVKVPAAQGVAR